MQKFCVGQSVLIKEGLPSYMEVFENNIGIVIKVWSNKIRVKITGKSNLASNKANFYNDELKLLENNIKKL